MGIASFRSSIDPAGASPDLPFYIERGSGPPLVLVHGLMVTGEMFEPMLDDLSARHRVIVPDLRGHGRSRGLPPPYTVSQLASDLAGLLDHLGIPSAPMLGYSQGGAVAQQFALDYPQRCEKLILVCSYSYDMVRFREKIDSHFAPILIRILGMRLFGKFVVSQALTHLKGDRAEWLAGVIGSQDPGLMVAAWKETMAFDSRSWLSRIGCPTLVVSAAEDKAVPIHHGKMLHAGINGSRLEVVEGADHGLFWTHPRELLRMINGFLETTGR